MASIDRREVERLFRGNYRPTKCVCRDRELEKYLIRRSKVEMGLLARLASGVRDPWQGRLTPQKGLWRGNVELRSRLSCPTRGTFEPCRGRPTCTLTPHPVVSFQVQVDVPTGTNPLDRIWLGDVVIEISHGTVTRSKTLAYPLREVDGNLAIESAALTERLYLQEDDVRLATGTAESCIKECQRTLAGRMTEIRTRPDSTLVGVRLVHLFCLLSGAFSEEAAVADLAQRLDISDDVFSYEGWLDGRNGWRQYGEMEPLGEGSLVHPVDDMTWFHYVCSESGVRLETIHRDPQNKTILPITAWTRNKAECRYYLNLPPKKPRLYGLDRILANKDATVFLTDSTEMMVANSVAPTGNDAVWASWYGEEGAVSLTDWSCLKGRNVYYIISAQPGCSRTSAYHTAYAVHEKLASLKRTRLTFVDIGSSEAGLDGHPIDLSVMSADDFHGYARDTLDLDAPPPKRGFAPRTMMDLAADVDQDRRFLLEPLIHERSTTLMYAWTSVGKTWFALCMGVTIAQGGTLFGRWKAKKPLKVLYIDSEMDEDSVRKRMRLVSKMRFDDRRLKRDRLRNLFYVSRKRSQADTDTFKKDTLEFVEKNGVSLVILDNLTAFTQHDDSARAWEDIHVWIDCLKERGKGCAVLLVHHENKKGDQRGTSATTNAVDNVIHLRSSEPKENDQNASDRRGKKQGDAVTPEAQNAASDSGEQPDDSAMKIEVEVEKGRDIYGVAKQLLTVVISPSTNPPFCKLVGVGGEEETGPLGASVLGQTPAKREYRDEGERDTLMQAVLARLEEGKRVKDIAVKYGISPSWIYGIKGRRKHPSWSASREARETARRERDSRIFERSAREGVRTIAASLKMSLTSVRRIIDAAWTKRIEEAPSFKEGKPPEEIAAELGTGTDAETVGRLMCEIRLRRVPDLWEKHMTVVEIARELGATTTRVEKRCRAIEAAERRSKQRCEDMAKVARLYGEHEHLPDKEIIRMTVLPRRTVIVELNRLDPSRRKPKRNPPPVPSAPSDPPAPPPAPG